MKKIRSYTHPLSIFLFACLFWQNTNFCAEPPSTPILDEMIDDSAFLFQLPAAATPSYKLCDTDTAFAIVNLLVGFGATDILDEDFYLRTNQLNTRPLLDLPVFEPNRCCYPYTEVLSASLFYNQTDKMHFSTHCDNMASYLALNSPSLLEKIEDALNAILEAELAPPLSFNVRRVLETMSLAFVEERKVGLMLHWQHFWDWGEVRFFTPIYWHERNFFLNEEEQDILAEELGVTTDKEQEEFAERYLISDRLGLGDTRVELTYTVRPFDCVETKIGCQLTLPTAWQWASGIKGTIFNKPSTQPSLDACNIARLVQEALDEPNQMIRDQLFSQLNNMLKTFFTDAFDRLSANLLDAPLGNGKHFGIGLMFRNHTQLCAFVPLEWAKKVYWMTRMSAEILFAQSEKRAYIKDNTPEQFADRDFDNPNNAISNLAFLEEKFIDRLFPIFLKTKVKPNFILRYTSRFCYQGDVFGFNIGSDWWIRPRNKFVSLQEPEQLTRQLDLKKVRAPFAVQSKIFGGIVAKIERPDVDWYISLNGDYTGFNKGIGHDYTATLMIEANF